ncbi:hypothetical protein [Streptomyces sp. NPDC058045]|uniref:hypothetical protein n=1 Tax=Streptomyces sp. NPDC058045 TaxID=3346311 RepID=UPI0036E01F8D
MWAGYFDEGVYGNLGWGGREGPEPSECGPLTLTGDTLWTTHPAPRRLPLIRVHQGTVTA